MTEKRTYELFISYSEADRAWVEGYLLDALEKAEVRFTCESAFTLGVPRILEFERAIKESRYTLLVISEAYLADDLTRFMEILAQSYGEQVGTWPVVPLTLQEGLQLPPRLKMLEGLKASSSQQWEAATERLCGQLKHPPPSPSPKPICPYPGMIPFSENDEERFFGRDGEIEELLGKLRLQPFFTVIGPSGSGKSSLVFAGLIPKLKQSGLFGAGQWCIRSLRPGTSPLANLQASLGGDVTAIEATIEQLLSTQPDARRLLLVVDQFEELFTQAGAETTPFQQALLKLIEIPNIYLILTVRADFYPDLMGSLLWENIRSHRFEVLPLDEKGLKQAIVRPAEGVEVYIDSALVERLVVDAKGEPGVLPLIQETLVLLWEHLERHYLPLKAYELLVLPRPAYGATTNQPPTGLQVAIARRADAALADFSKEQQTIARRIFLRLIQFGEGRPDTRRQQLEDDLRAFEDDTKQFDETLEHLAHKDRRLLTFSGEEGGQKRKVDIAHEALISGWPTFQQWISELREAEKTRRRLEGKAQEWTRLEKKGGLLDEVELLEAETWLSSNEAKVLGYHKYLYDLITTSREAIKEIERKKEEQEQRELKLLTERLEQERKARKAAQNRNVILTWASVIITVIGTFAVYQAINSQLNAIEALNQLSYSELASDRELEALVASVQAGQKLLKISWLDQIFRRITHIQLKTVISLQQAVYETHELNRLEKHGERVNSVSFSPDGKLLASASHDETVKLWSRNGTLIFELKHNERVTSVSFSPDGKLLASASADGTLKLWRIRKVEENVEVLPLKTLTGHKHNNCTQWYKCWVNEVNFSPNSQILASASRDNSIKLWDTVNGQIITTLGGHKHDVNAISFSSDGQTLASASSDGTVKFWNVKTGQLLRTLKVHLEEDNDGVTSIDFSPDDQTLVSASSDGTVKLWNVKTGQVLQSLEGHEDGVTSIIFSPDGQILVSASMDGTLKLWHKANGKWVGRETLNGHGSVVYSISFSPDSKTLMTAGEDKTVRLWTVPKLETLNDKYILSASLSPDGKTFAVADWDKGLQLWHRDEKISKQFDKTLEGHKDTVNTVNFSPNGELLASGSDDTTIRLWNPANGENIQTLTGHQNIVTSVTFSSDSKMLASASGGEDPTIRLWNLPSGNLILTFKEHEDVINSLSFSPNNKLLASGSRDQTIKLWSLDKGKLMKTLPQKGSQEGSEVNAVSFSPDGKILASANEDNTIKLWQVEDGTLLRTLEGHRAGVTSIAFNSDSNTLVSGDRENRILVWNPNRGILLKTLIPNPGSSEHIENINFGADDKVLMSAHTKGVLFWNLDLDDLLERGCMRLEDYLKTKSETNPSAGEILNTCGYSKS